MPIQCQTEIPAVKGLNDNELTVGREFLLVCQGEFPKDLKRDQLQFVLQPENKYLIQLKAFEFRSADKAELKVVSYTAGKIQFPDLQMTDGAQTFSLGPLGLQVESVLEKPKPGANPQEQVKQEPFGPIGPANIPVPTEFWIILLAVLGLVLASVAMKIYRVVQRRNILEGLKKHDSALSPLAEYHQGFRKLQRDNGVFISDKADSEQVLKCLDESYRMHRLYLTRKFQVPAMEWSPRLVLKDIKKHHRALYEKFHDDLLKVSKEFHRANQDRNKITAKDVLNIANHSRKIIEAMERGS
jgi:hypothetical protein